MLQTTQMMYIRKYNPWMLCLWRVGGHPKGLEKTDCDKCHNTKCKEKFPDCPNFHCTRFVPWPVTRERRRENGSMVYGLIMFYTAHRPDGKPRFVYPREVPDICAECGDHVHLDPIHGDMVCVGCGLIAKGFATPEIPTCPGCKNFNDGRNCAGCGLIFHGLPEGMTEPEWRALVHESNDYLKCMSQEGRCIQWMDELTDDQLRSLNPDEKVFLAALAELGNGTIASAIAKKCGWEGKKARKADHIRDNLRKRRVIRIELNGCRREAYLVKRPAVSVRGFQTYNEEKENSPIPEQTIF